MNDDRLSRESVFALSIVLSLVLHAALVYFSPAIILLTGKTRTQIQPKLSVNLIESLPEPISSDSQRTSVTRLVSRPERIEDLMKRLPDPVDASQNGNGFTQVPRLNERLAASIAESDVDLTPDPLLLQQTDAKVVEIAEQDARESVKVARRMVAPSSTRILEDGATPSMRGEQEGASADILGIDPLPSVGSLEPLNGTREGQGSGIGLVDGILAAAAVPEPIDDPTDFGNQVKQELKDANALDNIDTTLKVDITTYVPPGSKEGYYRIRVQPDKDKPMPILPKDVTFVVDASNSIAQPKLDQTVSAIAKSLDELRGGDRFNIILFRDTPTSFSPTPVEVTADNIASARKFLSGLKSNGETNVYEAIRPVLGTEKRPGTANMVVLLSDGRPTQGEKDAQTIINTLTEENARNKSIYAYGAGNTVNRYLLELLAYRNRGESVVSQKYESMNKDFPKFFENLSDPVLLQCDMQMYVNDRESIFPKEVSDLFQGRGVTLYGRYDTENDKDFVLRLTGQSGSTRKEMVFKGLFDDAAKGKDDIARNWAFRKAYHLIGEICQVGETPELMAELNALSKEYRISTVYSDKQ